MFVRLHRQRHAGREYTSVHLCESYRDPEKGGKPRSRVVYNLGPLDKLGMDAVRKLASGFRKIAGQETTDGTVISFPGGHDFGHVYALDRLIAVKEKAEPVVAKLLLDSSGSSSVDLVFYDITSTYFEGDRSIEEDDIRCFGYSRDGRFDRRQITIGVVMTGNGIPLCHHVFPGNTVDKTTVIGVVRDLKERFDLRNVIFVGDRGMLSDENLEAVLDQELGVIVAHPLRRNAQAGEGIGELWRKFDPSSEKGQFLS